MSHSPEGHTELYTTEATLHACTHDICYVSICVLYMFCTGAIYVAFINVLGGTISDDKILKIFYLIDTIMDPV